MVNNGDKPAAAGLDRETPRTGGVPYGEGVANHTGLASGELAARQVRKREREERIGSVLSRENSLWGADDVALSGRQHGGGRYARSTPAPRGHWTTSMYANYGARSRETPALSTGDGPWIASRIPLVGVW